MFTITTKANYGLLAILDLAERYEKELVQIKDIVARRGIPKNYLEQILNRLTKTGMVTSVRGNKGGYQLGIHPEKLTLLQVLETIEGDLKLAETTNIPVLKDIFGTLETRVKETLNITIAQMVERQQLFSDEILFYI
jgi:Rrf2 family protein